MSGTDHDASTSTLRLRRGARAVDTAIVTTAMHEYGSDFEIEATPDARPIDRAPPTLTAGEALVVGTEAILDHLETSALDRGVRAPLAPAKDHVRDLCAAIERALADPADADASGARPEIAERQFADAVAEAVRMADFAPWFAGDALTRADLYWYHYWRHARGPASARDHGHDPEPVAELPSLRAHREAMAARPSVRRTEARDPVRP